MKTFNEQKKKRILQQKENLEKALVDAIFELLDGRDSERLDLHIENMLYKNLFCEYFDSGKTITLENVEVEMEYYNTEDCLYYATTKDLASLNLTALFEIFNYLAL